MLKRNPPLVLLTQPYVPAYRKPLFDAIEDRLAEQGVMFRVAAGHPSGAQAARGDEVAADWRTPILDRSLQISKWRVSFRSIPNLPRPEVVVSELEALNTFAWSRLLSRSKLVLWGHGKPYVNDAGWLSEHLEWTLSRRADAVMTYTDQGREYLLQHGGLDPTRVTAIGNATDSQRLRHALERVDRARRDDLRGALGSGNRFALFVGGLDESKRIDFLLKAAEAALRHDSDFKLILVGRGKLESEVAAAIDRGAPIHHVPEAREDQLATLASVCSAIWMPGRVGLVAVDALALGLPVHTTHFKYHAPELDFLPESFLHFLTNDSTQYALESLHKMTEGTPDLPSDFPTISKVVSNFTNVIEKLLK